MPNSKSISNCTRRYCKYCDSTYCTECSDAKCYDDFCSEDCENRSEEEEKLKDKDDEEDKDDWYEDITGERFPEDF